MPRSPELSIRLFGAMQIERHGQPVTLPASRKTRALLGYLLLAPGPVSRSRLCDLLFDEPDDPRAALRWSLSKIRAAVDSPESSRLSSVRDHLSLDSGHVQIDALTFRHSMAGSPGTEATHDLNRLLDLLTGQLLADAELPNRPEYSAWLAATRAEFHAMELRLIDELLKRAQDDPARLATLWQRRIGIDSLDEAAYTGLAASLIRLGRRSDAAAMLDSAGRALRSHGLAPTARLHAPEKSRERTS